MAKKKLTSTIMKFIESLGEPDKHKKSETHDDGPPWLKYVAMLTGILAALAGFLVVRSTTLTNQAIFESNQAILAQAEASDAWAEYQADSIKARIVETQLLPSSVISAEDRAALEKTDQDFRDHQPQSKKLATDRTAERQVHMGKVQKNMAQKDLLEYAGLSVQLGIALASVAAMVRRKSPAERPRRKCHDTIATRPREHERRPRRLGGHTLACNRDEPAVHKSASANGRSSGLDGLADLADFSDPLGCATRARFTRRCAITKR
jgi:hypothetical protein